MEEEVGPVVERVRLQDRAKGKKLLAEAGSDPRLSRDVSEEEGVDGRSPGDGPVHPSCLLEEVFHSPRKLEEDVSPRPSVKAVRERDACSSS